MTTFSQFVATSRLSSAINDITTLHCDSIAESPDGLAKGIDGPVAISAPRLRLFERIPIEGQAIRSGIWENAASSRAKEAARYAELARRSGHWADAAGSR